MIYKNRVSSILRIVPGLRSIIIYHNVINLCLGIFGILWVREFPEPCAISEISLTQEKLEAGVTELQEVIKTLNDKAEAFQYEKDAEIDLFRQRVTQLEEDNATIQEKWRQEVEDLQKTSAEELDSERNRVKESLGMKIRALQDNVDASNEENVKLEAMYKAEKAKREELMQLYDPRTYAIQKQEEEEEAELLACRQEAQATEHLRLRIPTLPQTASKVLETSWPGHDGSATCFRGFPAQPGTAIASLLLTHPTTEAVSVPKTFQLEEQTQPEQSMQEPGDPPILQGAADLQGATAEEPPILQCAAADLQCAAEAAAPLTQVEQDGAETACSWSMCGGDSSWVEVPDFNEQSKYGEPMFFMYKSEQEARGISNIFTLSWEAFIFKHPSLELVCSNPSRTCFPNCSTGICRHGATHQLAETHVRIQNMVTAKRLRSKHI